MLYCFTWFAHFLLLFFCILLHRFFLLYFQYGLQLRSVLWRHHELCTSYFVHQHLCMISAQCTMLSLVKNEVVTVPRQTIAIYCTSLPTVPYEILIYCNSANPKVCIFPHPHWQFLPDLNFPRITHDGTFHHVSFLPRSPSIRPKRSSTNSHLSRRPMSYASFRSTSVVMRATRVLTMTSWREGHPSCGQGHAVSGRQHSWRLPSNQLRMMWNIFNVDKFEIYNILDVSKYKVMFH